MLPHLADRNCQRVFAIPSASIYWTNGEKEAALCIQIMISAYLRPGEMFRIKLGDVVAPGSTCSHVAIVVAPFEQGRATKNQRFDETTILDDRVDPWLSKKFVEYTNLRKKKLFSRRGAAKADPKPIVMAFLATEFPRLGEKLDHQISVPRVFPQHVCLPTCRSPRGIGCFAYAR